MILDIFNQDAFQLLPLTRSFNNRPYVPGQIGRAGLFEAAGIPTLTFAVEKRDGKLALIEPTLRGGPGETILHEKSNVRILRTYHYQRDDSVLAEEVQGVREFGTENQLKTVQSLVNEKMDRHARDFDLTDEFSRLGAICGKVLTRSGATLVDSYVEFGYSVPTPVSLALDTATTDVVKICNQIGMDIEYTLEEQTTGLRAFVGRQFWEKLTRHKSVQEVWKYAQSVANQLGKTANTLTLGPITFERYITGKTATTANGGSPFIATNKGRVVPTGVPGMFLTRYSPADYMETVNTVGLPRYAKQWSMANGKGVHMEFQTNPVHLCTRPDALLEITE